jgi:hypothetical protein
MDRYPNESTLAAVETPMHFPSPRNDSFAIAMPARPQGRMHRRDAVLLHHHIRTIAAARVRGELSAIGA